MKIIKTTHHNESYKVWWVGKNLRLIRIDLTKNEGRDWKQWIGPHFIRGFDRSIKGLYGFRIITKRGIMWEITR